VFYLGAAALMIYVGVGLLRLSPYARLIGIGYFSFAVANAAVFYFAPGGHDRIIKIVDFQRSLFSRAAQLAGHVSAA
jgi:hypothetical protein